MKRIVSVYLIVVAAVLLVPPWEKTFQEPGIKERTISIEWQPLFSPPATYYAAAQNQWEWNRQKGLSVSIAGSTLAIEIGFVSVLAAIAALWTRRHEEARAVVAHLATSKS